MGKRIRKTRHKRRGAAAVEMAMVAPLFLLIIFSLVEFGRTFMVQQMMVNAAREGARAAVLEGSTEDDVKDVVEDYLEATSVEILRENIAVSTDPETAADGDAITVTIVVPYADISWLPNPRFLADVDLQSAAVMRAERAN